MTLSSEYKPQSFDSLLSPQRAVPHEQPRSSFMDQRQLGETGSRLPPSVRQCPDCYINQSIVHEIVSELTALEESQFQPRSTYDVMHNGLPHALRWVLSTIRTYSASIKDVSRRVPSTMAISQLPRSSSPIREPRDLVQSVSHFEKRRAEDYGDEFQRSTKQARNMSALELSRSSTFPTGLEAERRVSHQSITAPSSSHSPPRAISSPGSGFLPPPSPGPAPLNVRMLPSPASLNFPTVAPTLPSISSPATSYHSSAHTVHLQDLRREISIKTLEYQTLQREYNDLLQKLQRQQTKSAAFEKKFEVSDAEINSLTSEKERLQDQIVDLEKSIEELQHTREDERREHSANGTQYMRILEMANKLQEQGAVEKRSWITEKKELEDKIRTLEKFGHSLREIKDKKRMTAVEENVSATGMSDAPDTAGPAEPASEAAITEEYERPLLPLASQAVEPLLAEEARLGERVQYLESALTAVATSARAMMELGQSVFDKAETALIPIVEMPSPDPPREIISTAGFLDSSDRRPRRSSAPPAL